MEILKQLGVDQTIWIQLGFFIVSYLFLSNFLFKPYQRNLNFRKKNIPGRLEEANALSASAEKLAGDYSGKVKSQNSDALALYNKIKAEGVATEEKLLAAASEKALQVIEENRARISREITSAKVELQNQIPQLSALTAGRVLGRDLK